MAVFRDGVWYEDREAMKAGRPLRPKADNDPTTPPLWRVTRNPRRIRQHDRRVAVAIRHAPDLQLQQ
jgi:hypothetical protein